MVEVVRQGLGQKGHRRGTLEGNRVKTMDGDVRVMRASASSTEVGASHTVHSFSPSTAGVSVLEEAPLSRRERLIEATVQAVSVGSVDRLS
jgi:hypothetical protein